MSLREPSQRTPPVLTAKARLERQEQKQVLDQEYAGRKVVARTMSIVIGLLSWTSLFALIWLMLLARERWSNWQTWIALLFFFFVGLFSLPSTGGKP